MIVAFASKEKFEEAKLNNFRTILLSEAVAEYLDGIETGRYIIDYPFSSDQIEEMKQSELFIFEEEKN